MSDADQGRAGGSAPAAAARMEQMLRDALHARATQVTRLGGLQEPAPARRERRWGRRLAPVLAAAAVAAVLAGMLIGRQLLEDRRGSAPTPEDSAAAFAEPPASFLGLRDGALWRYSASTGAATALVQPPAGSTVSSAAIAAGGAVYYTVVRYNDSASGQLWRLERDGASTLLLDRPDWAPRSVAVRDGGGAIAVEAGSRENGGYLDDRIALVNPAGEVQRWIGPAAGDGTDLSSLAYLHDGRIAVGLTGADGARTVILDPDAAERIDDGLSIPVDPGWRVTATGSSAQTIFVAFASQTGAVELDVVDPTTFVSTATVYAAADAQAMTHIAVDLPTGAILTDRTRQPLGLPVDAGSTPMTIIGGTIRAIPGLEPPSEPPIEAVRVVGWRR